MCTQLNISAADLKARWEAHVLSKNKAITNINLAGARELRTTLARKIDVAVQSKARTGTANLFGPSRPAPTAGSSSSAAVVPGFVPVPQVSERRCECVGWSCSAVADLGYCRSVHARTRA